MTDKQIIIDGIDVSGCVNFRPDTDTSETSYINACSIGLWQRWYSNLEPSCIISCNCKDNPNCYYKQLKRKEQECEELNNIINEAKNSKLDLNSFFAIEATVGEYQLELDQLNEDRIEALKQLEFVRTLNTVQEAEIRKLSKTLTEIRELAKPYQRDIDKICGYCRKYDSCHACCIDDLKLYEYRTGTTKACERFVELERFNINIVANLILQKISEVEDE